MAVKSIRGGAGLGDALYVQSVARWLVAKGQRLEIRSDYADVFRPLAESATVVPFARTPKADIVAHYMSRHDTADDYWRSCCLSAGIPVIEMGIDWERRDIVDPLFDDRPTIAVGLPRKPLNRDDGDYDLILPDAAVLQRAIDLIGERARTVQIGKGEPRFRLRVDLDLANRTTVAELLDIASLCDGFLGFCSFMVPLAESFRKPALFVWSSRSLKAKGTADDAFLRRLTPSKVLHAETSGYVLDDAADISAAVDAFLDAVRGAALVRRQARGGGRQRAGSPRQSAGAGR